MCCAKPLLWHRTLPLPVLLEENLRAAGGKRATVSRHHALHSNDLGISERVSLHNTVETSNRVNELGAKGWEAVAVLVVRRATPLIPDPLA